MLGKKESMRLPSVILTCLVFSMGVAPVFAQTSQSYVINDAQSGQSFQVPYDITGAIVSDMSISPHDTSLVILLKSSDDGNLTMTLPRSLIDAKNGANDDQFFVLVDGAEADFAEHKTSTDRTITVFIPKDTIQVEVIGTQVVPEFGMLSSLVLVIAIISIITVSTKTRLKFV
ncbi:MAG: PEFG-CTERM sorting domain-containing protein [Nitrosotalea sp.]